MGTRERRDRQKQDVRARIMDAARELFDAQGYAAVSMRKLAEKIEYSPTAIYAYFKDKDDLLRQICIDDFDRFHANQAGVAAVADPLERVRRMGLAYIRFAAEHPNHFRRMFLDPPQFADTDETLARRGDPSRDGYAFFRMAVAEAVASGRMQPRVSRDLDLLTQTLWSAVHGVAAIWVAHHCDDCWVKLRPVEQLAAAVVDGILFGVARPKPVIKPSLKKVRR